MHLQVAVSRSPAHAHDTDKFVSAQNHCISKSKSNQPAARGAARLRCSSAVLGGGGGYNILARTTRLAQSLGNVPLIRNIKPFGGTLPSIAALGLGRGFVLRVAFSEWLR